MNTKRLETFIFVIAVLVLFLHTLFLFSCSPAMAEEPESVLSSLSLTIDDAPMIVVALTDEQKAKIKETELTYSYDKETAQIFSDMHRRELFYRNLIGAIVQITKEYPKAEQILRKHGVTIQ